MGGGILNRRRSAHGVVPTHTSWGVVWTFTILGVFAGFVVGLIVGAVMSS